MKWELPQEKRLYVLAMRDKKLGLSIVYGTLAPSPSQCWQLAIEHELLGTGHTRETIERLGYKARDVRLEVWVP